MPALRWDLYCRVIDNFGDVGVCWRLARALAGIGDRVRLVIDDAQALRWMAPGGAPGVQVQAWPGMATADGAHADVVVEAFGCDLPAAAVAEMAVLAARARPPVWINLEYLSAEAYVARSHGLPSPQRNGLVKWFYFPGFDDCSGGLLREHDLLARRQRFDAAAWRAANGLQAQPGERLVSLFCYTNPALPMLLHSLARTPTLLLLTPGPAQQQVHDAPPGLRLARVPWLSLDEYDHLLWASDLNFVRGEDSLVRAIWADAPWVWQAYPQAEGVHLHKVQALLQHMAAPPPLAALFAAWNGQPGLAWPGLPSLSDWVAPQRAWRDQLLQQEDLATRLRRFALGKALGLC